MTRLLKLEINPKRIYGLDILRACAILFVMARHSLNLLPHHPSQIFSLLFLDGVSIFFVLSGFLIGGILIKLLDKEDIDRKLLFNFWIRRWFRTIPNFFLVFSIFCALQILFTNNFKFSTAKWYYIFSQNLFSEHPWFYPEAWSLSVEEWFYLLIPLLIFITIKIFHFKPQNAILATAIIVIVTVTLFRYYRYLQLDILSIGEWDQIFRKQVSTRLDSIMVGVIGAYIYRYKMKIWFYKKKWIFGIGVLILLFMRSIIVFSLHDLGLFFCVFFFSINAIATLLLLPFLSSIVSGSGATFKAFSYLSLISYSMYLLNLSLIQQSMAIIPWTTISQDFVTQGYIKFSVFWTITVLCSILLYKYFELPIMNLRDHPKIAVFLSQLGRKNTHHSAKI